MTNTYADTNARLTLETTVARLNLERFCKMLSREANQTKRRTLMHLIAEEKARLDALIGSNPSCSVVSPIAWKRRGTTPVKAIARWPIGGILFSALNVTVFTCLSFFALSASCAIFLILELSQPFSGVMMISSAPLRHALGPL